MLIFVFFYIQIRESTIISKQYSNEFLIIAPFPISKEKKKLRKTGKI